MAIKNVTFEDKQNLTTNENIPRTNKVIDDDINQLKDVANTNANKAGDLELLNTTDKDSLVDSINELSYNALNNSPILTGRKIFGKPEYLQIVNVGSCPNNTTKEVSYQTADKFITDYYLIGVSSNNEIIKAPNASSSSLYLNVFFTSNTITLATNHDRSRFTGYVYIYFTYN